MMKRTWLGTIALVVALIFLGACGGAEEAPGTPTPRTPTPGARQPTGEPIRIGINIEQSGPASVQGEAYVRAATLWQEKVNREGGILGRPVELIIVDNKSDPTEAAVLTRRLVQQGVVAIVGPGTSPTTLAAMDAILESKIPVFSMGSADQIVVPVDKRPNVFKTPFHASQNVEAILVDMKRRGIQRVGLLTVNNSYGESGLAAWREAERRGDVQIVAAEKFEANATDVTPQLTNIMRANPQAVVVWAIPPGAPLARRNAVENLRINVPMYHDAGAGAELFLRLAGQAAEGAYMIHPKTLVWDQIPPTDRQYQVLQEFGRLYTQRYGDMSGFASYVWDALGMLKAAIEKAGSTDPQAIIRALENLGEYVGATGVYRMSPQDHLGLRAEDLVLVTIQGGKWRLVR
jgi:branched-chain amino acid transport system substrate-binding protein